MRSWNLGQAQRYLDREVTYSPKRLVQMQKCFKKVFQKKKLVRDLDRPLMFFLGFVRVKVRLKSNKHEFLSAT